MSINTIRQSYRIHHALVFLIVLTCASLFGCGGSGSQNINGNGTSGVRGVARIVGPNGVVQGVLPNAMITVQQPYLTPNAPNGYRPPSLKVQADAQGNYSIPLVPGAYRIDGIPQSSSYRSLGATDVVVTTGQFLQVDLQFTNVP